MSGESIRLWSGSYQSPHCSIQAPYLLREDLPFISQPGPCLWLTQLDHSLWVVSGLSCVITVPSCSKKMWNTVRMPHLILPDRNLLITLIGLIRKAGIKLGSSKWRIWNVCEVEMHYQDYSDFIRISIKSHVFIPCPYLNFVEACVSPILER